MFEYFYAGLQNHIESLLRVALILILWGIALRVAQRGIPHLREALVSRQTMEKTASVSAPCHGSCVTR